MANPDQGTTDRIGDRGGGEQPARPDALPTVDLTGGGEEPSPTLAHPTLPGTLGESEERAAPNELGRYLVKSKLGAGGMGEVWRVRDPELARDIAAKVLPGHADERAREKFVLEAQVTGQLQHPNIVPVHELCLSGDGQAFFTMKAVEGENLGDVLRRGAIGPDGEPLAVSLAPPLARRLQLFLRVCEAMAYAHSRGVIHRDLKPDNVMVGAFGEVQVMDWGLAKVLGQPSTDPGSKRPITVDLAGRLAGSITGSGTQPAQTMDGAVMGTPAYMSPEQAEGRIDELDERCDVYALGAILYETLTLRCPFPDSNPLAVLEQVAYGEFLPPSERRPDLDIPWELEVVVIKAMPLDPADRYASVGALKEDIEAFLDDRLVTAARYSLLQRFGRWLRANRQRLIGAVAAVAIAAVATGLYLDAARRAEQKREFERYSQQARDAEEARDWARAEIAGRRALDRGASAELETLVANAHAKRQQRAAALKRIAERQKLQEKLQPLIARIESARMLFYLPRIDIRTRLDDVRDAADAIEVLAADPRFQDQGLVWRALGEARLLLGQTRAAERALLRAYERKSTRVATILGTLHLRRAWVALLGNPGVSGMQKFAAVHSKMLVADKWLMRGVPQQSKTDTTVQAYTLQVQLKLAKGDMEGGEALALRGLKDREHTLGVEELWIALALAQGRTPQKARASLDRAIERCPHHAWAHFLRSSLDPADPRSEADLDRAIELAPEMVQALVNRASLRVNRGALQAAAADLARALQLSPNDGLALVNRAKLKDRDDDLPGAMADLDAALAARPELAIAHYMRGLILGRRKMYKRALPPLERAIQMAPISSRWVHYRATIHIELGDDEAALRDLDRAILLDPRYACAHANRCLVRGRKGDMPGARRDADRAVALAPTMPSARRNRVRVRMFDGDVTGALADLEILARQTPEPLVILTRGVVRAAAGKRAEAIADFQAAARANPGDPYSLLWLSTLDGRTERLEPLLRARHWTALVAAHWTGRLGADQFAVRALANVPAAHRAGRVAQVYAFVGIAAERAGDRASARRAYETAAAAPALGSVQRFWALVRLRALPK